MIRVEKALWSNVIVLPDTPPARTESGLYQVAVDNPQTGRIKFAGADCKVLKRGDRVLFLRNAGTGVFFDGRTHLVMDQEMVKAVLEE